MAEQQKPTINSILFVSEADLELIKHWPLEIRGIFDPKADRELAERARIAREEAEQRHAKLHAKLGDKPPF